MAEPCCTEERFLNDIKDHKIDILRNEGVNRHLRFRKPGTICYGFDLITWPGHLCVSGDCGTYVFQRLEDMFEFFRTDNDRINPGYWSEKAIAVDKNGGIMKFSPDKFKENVKDYFDNYFEDIEDEEFKGGCWEEIKARVLPCVSNGFDAYEATENFEYETFQFRDFWEYDSDEYDFLFLWNLYAIVWGINLFDETVDGEEVI